METDINDFNGKMKVLKSENNQLFYEYIRFLGSMKEKASKIEGNDNKRSELDLLVKNFQKNKILNNQDKLAAKVLAMSIEPILPDEIKDNDSLKYRFFLNHYWDNIDVTDNRIVHTPVYHKKLDFSLKMILKSLILFVNMQLS